MAPNKPSKQRKFFVNNITHLRNDGLLKFSTKFQLYFWAIAFCEHPRCLCGQVRSRYRCISRSAKLLSMLHFNMITNYGQTGRVTKVECGALHAASSSRAAELQSCLRLLGPHIYGQEEKEPHLESNRRSCSMAFMIIMIYECPLFSGAGNSPRPERDSPKMARPKPGSCV